jgi:predicted nucleic acid-binding protein
MKPVFADTSYYVALVNPGDTYHEQAIECSQILLGRVIVTEYILIELGNAISDLIDRHLYVPLVKELLNDPATLFIPASQKLFQQGLALFQERMDKNWSIVDCISFVIMRQRRLTDALTADRHFEQAGYRALLREKVKK